MQLLFYQAYLIGLHATLKEEHSYVISGRGSWQRETLVEHRT